MLSLQSKLGPFSLFTSNKKPLLILFFLHCLLLCLRKTCSVLFLGVATVHLHLRDLLTLFLIYSIFTLHNCKLFFPATFKCAKVLPSFQHCHNFGVRIHNHCLFTIMCSNFNQLFIQLCYLEATEILSLNPLTESQLPVHQLFPFLLSEHLAFLSLLSSL